MKLRFFAVPMLDGEEESQELNRFLATNRVLMVERHFVSDGSRSAWAICVSYLDRGGRPAPEQDKGSVSTIGKSFPNPISRSTPSCGACGSRWRRRTGYRLTRSSRTSSSRRWSNNA